LTCRVRALCRAHQMMPALIDWSYDLLAPVEQRPFEQPSIFAGGCAINLEDVRIAHITPNTAGTVEHLERTCGRRAASIWTILDHALLVRLVVVEGMIGGCGAIGHRSPRSFGV
jgi:hypothetical protein